MEISHVNEWAEALGPEWKVIPNNEFPPWLKKLFPGGNEGPDMVAINTNTKKIQTKQILVGDVTTKPWIEHMNKTQRDTSRIARNLPDEYKDFEVTGQEKYWEHAVSPEDELPPDVLDEMRKDVLETTGEEAVDPEIFRTEDVGLDPTLDTPEYSEPIKPKKKPKKEDE
jgi:hypothetical protein